MEAKVIFNHECFKGIFDFGDKVKIEAIVSDRREVLSTKRVPYTKQDSRGNYYKGDTVEEDVVRPKGSYLGYKIKSKNGHYYDDHAFFCVFGYKSLDVLFKKK